MRKLAAALAVAAVPVLGMGASALAYPPGAGTLFLSSSNVAPGEVFTATLAGCTTGETVTFSIGDDDGDDDALQAATATCDDTGNASASLTAPSETGSYTVSAVGGTSGVSAAGTLTVSATGDDDGDDGTGGDDDDGDDGAGAGAGGGTGTGSGTLPATGSESAPIAQIAGGTLIAGLGLGAVAWRRRRPAMA